jgi:hypothetical protein
LVFEVGEVAGEPGSAGFEAQRELYLWVETVCLEIEPKRGEGMKAVATAILQGRAARREQA